MAFGIDDFLLTISAGVNLSDTLVRTIKNNSSGKEPGDIPALIAEVKTSAIRDIKAARSALEDFQDLLERKGVDIDKTLLEAIERTSFWNPVERYRLKRAQRSIDNFKEATYHSCDDVAALVRCLDDTGPMGSAVVESSRVKREFREMFRNASSVREMIDLLHEQLDRHERALAQ